MLEGLGCAPNSFFETFSAYCVKLSLGQSDIGKDNILCTLFLLLFILYIGQVVRMSVSDY